MKKLIILFFMIYSNNIFSQNLSEIRALYYSTTDNISKCNSLKTLLNSFENKNNIINAYIGANTLLYCKYSDNSFKKYSYFKKGKEMIEEAIKLDPDNLEIKFLRFLNQINAPWFLNYKSNIDDDFKFINSNLDLISDERFKKIIIETLKAYK
tara:strand:+ start:101 stop:559 length:459 start_codon:yes stop_codon:yes gene_type:complete